MSLKSTLIAALSATVLAVPAFAEGVEVHDQYARSSGMSAVAGAAFMTIHNHGDHDDRLIDAHADVSARVELHTHIDSGDGVMLMRHVPDGFELPAGGEIVMERGGKHVMFMGLNDPMEQDETFELTLVFEHAGEVVIEVPVDLERDAMGSMDHGDMDHGEMDHGDMDKEDEGHDDH
ncbi:copper chaperone PCu(A)C [Aestuariibius sp. HNIBRBA575]|uniref:copper chaperone PCu(A)C n=1 Tax=Aestuariibius sp. HNIBRBA575 TaxID=3233343 RepID=UPI0034A3C2AA